MTRRPSRAGSPVLVPGLLLGLLVALVASGCAHLPTTGPVVESRASQSADMRRASDIDARPPVAGASRSEVVSGFLDAMTAWPVQTGVAKQYLTVAAAEQWDPEQGTVVYSDTQPARESGGTVTVPLTSASSLDSAGAWRGPLAGDDLTLDFRVTVEDGEYRIADPVDALVVPSRWFQQRYRQVSLYFFDPLAQILVPEPVFVPVGEQLATSLVAGLLAGPPPQARGVVRTFVPDGLSVGLSVPVDAAGIARIALVGAAPRLTAGEAELMLAQLAWTLRQDSAVRALRVTVDGADLPLSGGGADYPVDRGEAFDPAGADATRLLYGVADGRLVWGPSDNLAVAKGVLGAKERGLVTVAARPDGAVVAVVDSGGSRLRIGGVRDTVGPSLRTVLSGGVLRRPTWDAAGRLWVLQERGGRAVVWVVDDRGARKVRVPGISGRSARQLLVSRDGTRLVAVVRGAAGDRVVGARVVLDPRGAVARAVAPFVLRPARGTRIRDLAWTGPSRIALLTPTVPGTLSEIDVVSADGATGGDELSTIVAGDVIGLAADPSGTSPILAVLGDRLLDIVTQGEHDVPAGLTELDYPG
ncbi:GerMN domain-containing protein [Nocardioides sp. zg-ZUI104]|uniref:LpqB family beta-propeller domain-containing protein n=1 Tax=Nocardioides faecalis TaxID=2803858 RepID=UPI001BCC8813|nr:LpqB family beta-propeller domain-containing protein [Nocardioides faecalis]MBS4751550.1 GerMN domain-containing protein [Nocardioides faecalis]